MNRLWSVHHWLVDWHWIQKNRPGNKTKGSSVPIQDPLVIVLHTHLQTHVSLVRLGQFVGERYHHFFLSFLSPLVSFWSVILFPRYFHSCLSLASFPLRTYIAIILLSSISSSLTSCLHLPLPATFRWPTENWDILVFKWLQSGACSPTPCVSHSSPFPVLCLPLIVIRSCGTLQGNPMEAVPHT